MCTSALQLEVLEFAGDSAAQITDGKCVGSGGGMGGAMECRALLMNDLLDMVCVHIYMHGLRAL